MSEIGMKWYVLRAISGKETKVKEYLDADIKNSNLGEFVSQVLIPTEKVYQVRNGKKVVKERTYLPGYVLVEAALVGEVAHHLRNTPNVLGFLGGLVIQLHFVKLR
jgi:transcriptional antiterminator NusG